MRFAALSALTLTVLFSQMSAFADEATSLPSLQPAAGVSESLANEARAAINRGMDWLLAKQNEDGHWSNPDFPALTALPLWALTRGGSSRQESLDKAVSYILASVRENGAICRDVKDGGKDGALCNYNTALCMVALFETGRPDLTSVIQKAREAIAATQHFGSDVYHGGMGYDESTGRAYADLSNSYIAYEAMRITQNVEDLRKAGEKHADLDWEAARQFVQRIQNLRGSNDQAWASDAPDERGGFAYNPVESKAGSYTDSNGAVRLRSYASMTYAGLLSLIYAEVNKEDPRVASAFDWASRHWSLEENPGMEQAGLYYFFNVLSKALATYGQDVLTLPDGKQVNWREALITKLVSLQKTETDGTGYWVNEKNRWWESDPVLVTSYSLLALEVALGK